MGNNQEIITYQDAIQSAIDEQFSDYNNVVFKAFDPPLKAPAIVFDRPTMEILESQPVKGKLHVNLKANVFVCFSLADDNCAANSLQLSANLSNFIHGNSWGLKMAPAQAKIIEPTNVEGFEDFAVQVIDFQQRLVIIDNN